MPRTTSTAETAAEKPGGRKAAAGRKTAPPRPAGTEPARAAKATATRARAPKAPAEQRPVAKACAGTAVPAKRATPAGKAPAKTAPVKKATPVRESAAGTTTPATKSPAAKATPAKKAAATTTTKTPAAKATPAKKTGATKTIPAKKTAAEPTRATKSPTAKATPAKKAAATTTTAAKKAAATKTTPAKKTTARTTTQATKSPAAKPTPKKTTARTTTQATKTPAAKATTSRKTPAKPRATRAAARVSTPAAGTTPASPAATNGPGSRAFEREPSDVRWQSRPWSAAAVRAVAVAVPLIASIATGFALSRSIARPGGAAAVAWWVGISVASMLVLAAVDRFARRLLPLAVLLKLSMAFPDRAPSRFSMAARAGSTRNLKEQLRRAEERGTVDEPAKAAERILTLLGALSAHDRRTRGHSERVRAFNDLIAHELRLPQADRDRLRWAALLHDIGKLHVSPRLLNKPDRPTEKEWALLKSHPTRGARIAAPLNDWLGEWASTIEQHHERWDGRGYPAGLKETEIGLGARIVAVADAYEVMTAPRPYSRPVSAIAARKELARCAGEQFDPEVVRAFLNISIGSLRKTIGPLSWLAQLPLLGAAPRLESAVGVAGRQLATAAATATGTGVLALGAMQNAPHHHHHHGGHETHLTMAAAGHSAGPTGVAHSPAVPAPSHSPATRPERDASVSRPAHHHSAPTAVHHHRKRAAQAATSAGHSSTSVATSASTPTAGAGHDQEPAAPPTKHAQQPPAVSPARPPAQPPAQARPPADPLPANPAPAPTGATTQPTTTDTPAPTPTADVGNGHHGQDDGHGEDQEHGPGQQ